MAKETISLNKFKFLQSFSF